jgi:hypothetical protein
MPPAHGVAPATDVAQPSPVQGVASAWLGAVAWPATVHQRAAWARELVEDIPRDPLR